MKTIAKPIQMVNWMDEDGSIYPVRFKILDEEGNGKVVKVSKMYKVDKTKIAGNKTYTFMCEITLNNTRRVCEIRYDLETCRWMLFKV